MPLQLGDLARLDEVLPELSREVLPEFIGHALATESSAISESSATADACFGAGNGIRTHDLQHGKLSLYH